jgi:hypothetical protein
MSAVTGTWLKWPSPVLAGVLTLLLACLALAQSDRPLKLNEIQVLGSHNSYKLAMQAETFAALRERNPGVAQSLEYWHLPLDEQLDLGIRKLELDVFYDPDGSRFPGAASGSGSQFPVLHVQNLDDRSSCTDLVRCLEVLDRWSEAHPGHLPVFLSFNAKDAVIDQPGFLQPLPFGEDAWTALDGELRGILGARLIQPGSVFQGNKPVWPLLDAARGSFLAILDEGGAKRSDYASRWRDRAMFANLPENEPGAAIMIINDPIGDFDRIQRLVRQGFIVRTRADADTREARSGDTTRRDKAFASGAQLISTDYYLPATHFGTDYQVSLPAGMRCNPLLRLETCQLTQP